jgi:hypothetical protein
VEKEKTKIVVFETDIVVEEDFGLEMRMVADMEFSEFSVDMAKVEFAVRGHILKIGTLLVFIIS